MLTRNDHGLVFFSKTFSNSRVKHNPLMAKDNRVPSVEPLCLKCVRSRPYMSGTEQVIIESAGFQETGLNPSNHTFETEHAEP